MPAKDFRSGSPKRSPNHGGLTAGGVGGRGVARGQALHRDRHEQIPLLDAVQPTLVQQPAGPGEPAAAAGHLAPVQESEAQPERAAGGTRYIARAEALVKRARPGIVAVVVPAHQKRGHGEPLEVRDPEWRLMIRGRELGIRIRPGMPTEGAPAAIECVGSGHTPPQRGRDVAGRAAQSAVAGAAGS